MDGPRVTRPVQAALRCYPPRWRRRHGDEAAELAALLLRDGKPAVSIAWSYLAGAARAWLAPLPGRRLSTAAGALLAAACAAAIAAGLLASTVPARAASPARTPACCCRPAPAARVPPVTPAASRPQPATGKARHDRSC